MLNSCTRPSESPEQGTSARALPHAQLPWIAVSVALLLWGSLYIARTSFVYDGTRVFCLWDDGMISMTYARNLARGEGLIWNAGGEAVQGYSNPLVTLVMAAIHLLPIDSFKISLVFQILNLGILLACASVMASLARRLLRDDWLGWVAALSIACSAGFTFWTLQGSDVGFVALWLLTSLLWLTSRGTAEQPWPAGLWPLLAVGPVIRPDSVIFLAVFGIFALCLPGERLRRVLRGGALFAVVGGAMLLFNNYYYSDPLPNTYYLKATGAPRGGVVLIGLAQLRDLLPGALIAVGLAGVGVWKWRHDRRFLLCAGLCVAAILYHVWVGGDWARARGSRFITVVFPLLALLAIGGARALLGERRVLVAGAVALAAISVNTGPTIREWFDPREPTYLRSDNQKNLEIARYIRDHSDSDTRIAVLWGGVYPYFGERFSIDVWGKSDRYIAKLPATSLRPGHSKRDWNYIVERRPDLIMTGNTPRLLRLKPFRRNYLRAFRDGRLLFYIHRDSRSKLKDPDLSFLDFAKVQPPSQGES